ncbi:MAG: hypothetical protein O3B24_04915 [Verrucomicrobia bacterium]|nr:hypothetical protein [Verrucomicrobiota bacterium]
MSAPFYIGYNAKMPPATAAFLRRWVVALFVAGAGVAVALAGLQHRYGDGQFEFGIVKSFDGIISESPYPNLIVRRPIGTDAKDVRSRVLLVAPGKHGAQELVRGLEGRAVTLQGSLITRDNQSMIEVRPGTIAVQAAAVAGDDGVPLGNFTLRGEIVDSKCYFGVMKPGNLKPHKACAIRCISGGCPPVLVVRDADGMAVYFVLAGSDGGAVSSDVLDKIAEPLEITGEVERQDNVLVLKAEPGTYRRLE